MRPSGGRRDVGQRLSSAEIRLAQARRVGGKVFARAGEAHLPAVEHVALVADAQRQRGELLDEQHADAVVGELTVLENMTVAARDGGTVRSALELFPELEPRHDTKAALLSGGEQQM
ncbi:MAG: transporter ATP-binding protein, partial [Conexibacter sp.]|nr:transporter ATP-binding protein [Conexibacter sp.]